MDSYIYLKDRAGNNLGTSDNPLVIYATGGATSTTVHNSLLSLQGGNGADEFYHLNATSYASVIAWDVGSGGSGDYSVISGYATNSGYATKSGYATAAGTATNASFSLAAGTASALISGVVVDNSTFSVSSGFATNATFAISSGTATNASYSVLSGYATLSGTATNANYALVAANATLFNTHADTYFATAAATLFTYHNNALGKQGNGVDYYHLDSTQYASVAAWNVGGSPTYVAIAGYATACGTASSLLSTATIAATKVILPVLSGTSIYNNVNGWFGVIQSGGRIQGGVISASATAGLADVSQTDIFIKTQDSEIGETRLYTVAATAALALYSDTVTYIYVDYNNGIPIIRTTNDRTAIKYTTQFTLGRAFKHTNNEVEVLQSGINTSNRTRRVHERWVDTFGGVSYANGLVVSSTGLKPAITSGVLYAGSNRVTVTGTDFNVGGTFEYYYTTDSGSTWTTAATNTIDNNRYNDSATGLATLGNNQYGIHWVYVCPEGEVYVLYGKGSYTLAQAQSALVASPIPNYLNQWAKLAAKLIVGKGLTTLTQITSAWTTQFPVQNAANHNDLGGLEGLGTNYYHLNSTQYASVAAWNVGGSPTYVPIAGYATSCGTATNATYAASCGTASTTTATHNSLSSPDGGGNGHFYHLNDASYASVTAWNVAPAMTRLTEISTTISFLTTDGPTGKQFSFDATVSYGQIARLRLYTDFKAGQQANTYGTVTAVGGMFDYSTQATYTWTSGTKFQANDYILIDNEIMLVTATTAYSAVATMNVTRAQKGTRAAPHDNGAAIVRCNDGVRIEIFPDNTYSPANRILKWGSNFTWSATTSSATGANYYRLNMFTSPTVCPDFGANDIVYLSDTASSEYIPIQQVYGDIAGTIYDNSISLMATTAYAHNAGISTFKICEMNVPIPYKVTSGTTLYGMMYVDELTSATVTATLLSLIDKWGA